jgi:outer membrane protein assembly factor BamB
VGAIAAAGLVLALTGLAAACGSTPHKEAAKPTATTTTTTRTPPPVPAPRRRAAAPVLVTVVDGDTHRRVAGARVVVGRRSNYADRLGVASLPLRQRGAFPVRVSAPGYETRTVRIQFRNHPRAAVRLYRPVLQWPLYGANARRTQAPTGIDLRPPFRLVWSRGLGGLIEFPAVVSDGVAYIGNYRGTVYALSMRDGAVVWRHRQPGGKMASSPTVAGDVLVVHGMDGYVRLLDRSTGAERWAFRVGSPVESSPIVRDGIDYFGAWNGRIYALDLRTHRVRWIRSTGAKITSSASLTGGTLYIGDYAGRLWALSARSGRTRWTGSVGGRIYGTPAVADGRVFVPSSTAGSLTAFSTGGRFLWRVDTGSYVYSSPAVWASRVFFGSYNGRLYAVSMLSGRRLWSVSANGPVSGAAVVVAGVAYAGSTWGRITGVDARTGRVVLRFPHGEYVPVSGNGGRLLLHGYSRIYAVEPRTR